MDKESGLLVLLIVIVEALVLQIYIPFPTGFILSILIGGIVVIGAYRIEKYLDLNIDSHPYR